MSTAVETAHVPGYKAAVLPIYGCATPCEVQEIGKCWLKCKSGTMLRQRLGRFCPDCKTMKPHVHWERIDQIYGLRKNRYYSGHMCEMADLKREDIENLQIIFGNYSQHLFAPFTHRPMEFYADYCKWPKNAWCCGTWTSGEIAFPPQLECGVRVAYCEPVLGELHIVHTADYWDVDKHSASFDWLVIGPLNHGSYEKLGITLEQLAGWIKPLMADARALGIKIFCKKINDPRWKAMGITPMQEWLHGN